MIRLARNSLLLNKEWNSLILLRSKRYLPIYSEVAKRESKGVPGLQQLNPAFSFREGDWPQRESRSKDEDVLMLLTKNKHFSGTRSQYPPSLTLL